MKKYIDNEYCPHCGCDLFDVVEQKFKNGKIHLRATCDNCKKFIKYISQEKEFRLPFGIYKGKLLSEVPKDYIDWLLSQNIKHNLRYKINKFYEITI